MEIGLFRWEIQMSTKKILAFTGIRSDYDLMSGVYKKIQADSDMEIGLIVSGAHLSESYGYSVKYIENDGIPIIAKITTLLDSNQRSARLKAASIMLQSCLPFVESYNPNLIVYAGDREDVIVGALVGTYLGIPTAHFFGGDHTKDGNVDNPIRHATSKLSSSHFVIHNAHKQRLIKMGENNKRIFVIGSPALDKFIDTPILTKPDLMKRFQKNWENYAILIFHPNTGTEKLSGVYFENILQSLIKENVHAFVNIPNTDAGNKYIIEVINKYIGHELFYFFKNVDRYLFVNLMRNADFMIGNSSAGLIEAPIIPLATVNVGCRQQGRLNAGNVIFCENNSEDIVCAINTIRTFEFEQKLQKIKSPFGDGTTCDKTVKILKEIDFQKMIFKKEDPLG